MRRLVYDEPRMARWLGTRGVGLHMPYRMIGVEIEGRLACVTLWNAYEEASIEVSAWCDDPKAISPAVLRALFAYPFLQLKVARLTARTRAKAEKTRDLIERMGFRPEGRLRRFFGDDDAVMYGLLREECRCLERNHGQHAQAAART